MKTPQNIQPSFDDEISIADIIHFFKSHKKMILIFVIIGALLGGLYGNFTEPVYEGSILISPAKIAGTFVHDPKTSVTKLHFNSFYSKEVFLNCSAQSSKVEDKHFNISNLVKFSVTKDGGLIELRMQNKNKTLIENCLNSILADILANQNTTVGQFIQSKIYELKNLEEKLKYFKEFKFRLNDKQNKEFKKNNEILSLDLIYSNLLLLSDIKETISEINKIKIDLSLEQTKLSGEALPLNFEKKSPLTPKLGALIGLFLGLCLGISIALIKQMKI
jgi:capsular polysaccharide biosynthesis protein